MALCGWLMASNTYSCVFWKLFYNKYINHTYIYTHLFEGRCFIIVPKIKIPVNIIHRNFPTKKKKFQVTCWQQNSPVTVNTLPQFLLRLGIVLMKCNPTRISFFFFLTWLHMKIEGIFAKNPPTKIHWPNFKAKAVIETGIASARLSINMGWQELIFAYICGRQQVWKFSWVL